MANDSSTGGPLVPATPNPPEPSSESLLQALFTSLLPPLTGDLVRPEWQAKAPNVPQADVTWCAFGLISSVRDAGPTITHDGQLQVDAYERGVEQSWIVHFYGPLAGHYSSMLVDGLSVPQNTDVLLQYGLRFGYVDGPIVNVPAFVNQQWILGRDVHLMFRRKIDRTYQVLNLQPGDIHILDDTFGVDRTVSTVPS